MRLKTTSILFLGIFLFTNSFLCQIDPIEQEIMDHITTHDLVAKGRSFIIENLAAGNTVKVRETFDFLNKNYENESTDMIFHKSPFSYIENILINYYLKDYDQILSNILAVVPNHYQPNNYRPIYYSHIAEDHHIEKVMQKWEHYIKESVQISNVTEERKEFLLLFYDYLRISQSPFFNTYDDTLNSHADKFISSFPYSENIPFVKENIRHVLIPSEWSSGWSFNLAFHPLEGALDSSFTHITTLGLDKDVFYKKFYINAALEIGSTITKDTISINDNIWLKDDIATAAITRLNLGYSFETNRIRFIPNLGIGSTGLYAKVDEDEDSKDEDRAKIGSTFTTNIGLTIDYKLRSNRLTNRRRNIEKSFGFIRFKYNYSEPRFQKRFNRFDGVYQTFSIGYGRYTKLKHRDLNSEDTTQ
jgi:hypothetical protein